MIVRPRTTDAETAHVTITAPLDVIARLQTTDAEIFTALLDLIEDIVEEETPASHIRLIMQDTIRTHHHTRGLQLAQDTETVTIAVMTVVIDVRKGNRWWVD